MYLLAAFTNPVAWAFVDHQFAHKKMHFSIFSDNEMIKMSGTWTVLFKYSFILLLFSVFCGGRFNVV